MIELRSVSKVYRERGTEITALHDMNLTIQSGEFVAIVGPSGSGKSTMLNLIGCLDRPSSGQLVIDDVVTRTLSDIRLSRLRNRSIGMIFQTFNLIPELTVLENVELPLVYAGAGRGRHLRARQALAQVGMEHRSEHRAAVLSGGEQQRVAIARALSNDPDIILADEPTGSIDLESAEVVHQLFCDLHSESRTIVVVTHNPDVALWAQRVVRLADGTVIDPGHPLPPPVRRGRAMQSDVAAALASVE